MIISAQYKIVSNMFHFIVCALICTVSFGYIDFTLRDFLDVLGEEFLVNAGDYIILPGPRENTVPIENAHFSPHPGIIDYYMKFVKDRNMTRILEVGPGFVPFPAATHVIDHQLDRWKLNGVVVWNLDMDFEKIPVEDNYFDFVYCRHVLEDLNYPLHAYKEITRVSKNGYFETPAPLIESLRLGLDSNTNMRGYIHHRYMLWTDTETNILYALPKFPLLDHIVPTVFGNVSIEAMAVNVAISQPHSWNNHYVWYEDEDLTQEHYSDISRPTQVLPVPNRKANGMKIVKHDIDYPFDSVFSSGAYARMIRNGIKASMMNTINFAVEELDAFLLGNFSSN